LLWDHESVKKSAIVFDLGGTLVEYYDRDAFPPILENSIRAVQDALAESARPVATWDMVWRRTLEQNFEASDHRVRPLAERLATIFGLSAADQYIDMSRLSRAFMQPIFSLARVYDDAVPTLEQLRASHLRIAIASNTPWGSPPDLWHEELIRLGLAKHVDEIVFCCDVGWRKPDPQILELVAGRLGASIAECLFVGDDPRWDIVGAQAAGMDAILLDRRNKYHCADVLRLPTLEALPTFLEAE
jgi:putative hydrolase of the HAD superfamily